MTILTLEGIDGHVRDAIKAMIDERKFQDDKYGPPIVRTNTGEVVYDHNVRVQGSGGHEIAGWLLIIEKELEEAKEAAVHGGSKKPGGRNTVRSEIVQIMAVCLAALEQHGVRE